MTKLSVSISPEIKNKLPGVKLGFLQAEKIMVKIDAPDFEYELEKLSDYIKTKFREMPLSKDPVIASVRRLYYRIGWEPTRYRPSSEALARRILKDKGLYRINNLVDYGNLISARFHLPMGLYDVEKIKGDIQLDIGKSNESYRGISKEKINAVGKLILRDDDGIFGNPTADSKRTSIQKSTQEVLAVFFCPRDAQDQYINETLSGLSVCYQNYTAIPIETGIVSF